MATNVFSGKQARLLVSSASSVAGANFGSVRNFSLAVNRELIDAGSFDTGGWREHITGEGTWTLTAEALFLSSGVASQQDELRSGLSSETRQWFRIQNTSGSSGVQQAGFGYVTGWGLSGDKDDIQLHDFTVTGDGALTESANTTG